MIDRPTMQRDDFASVLLFDGPAEGTRIMLIEAACHSGSHLRVTTNGTEVADYTITGVWVSECGECECIHIRAIAVYQEMALA